MFNADSVTLNFLLRYQENASLTTVDTNALLTTVECMAYENIDEMAKPYDM